MSNKTFLKELCAAEAAGELDEPTPPKRRYWVHPLNSDREKNKNFFTPKSFLNITECR